MPLIQMKVSPVNCQVVLLVPDAREDPPEWPTGRELVVANSGCVYVSTICEIDGDVNIEVWTQDLPHHHGEPIYDGTLEVRDAGAFVGSLTGDHLGFLPLTEGEHRVQVYTDPPGPYAERVYFLLD